MQLTRYTSSHVDVISDSFDLSSIDKVSRTNCLTNYIVVILTCSLLEPKLLRNIQQLLTNLSHFS